jgi:site-specific DNA-methyltransferase (adenine-specific)
MEDMINKVFNEDCLETMKRMPDKSIDLVLTDPPYGIGMDGKVGINGAGRAKEYQNKNWDKSTPSKEIFDEIIRVSKNQIIFGANHFIDKIPYSSSCWLFWDKDNNKRTLVIATHGFIKKTSKVPQKEINKANQIMKIYFEEKQ